jgi:putative ABC transport system permease protein
VRLLVASFSVPVLVANVAVWPIGYYAARAYLGAFLDPIALTPAPFALALAATVAIALLAVGTQTLRAARTVPSRVLRDE